MPVALRPGQSGAVWRLEGRVRADDGDMLAQVLEAWEGTPAALDLEELELEDGVSVARAASVVDALVGRLGSLTLLHAPQMLAHTLYKVGRLRGGALTLTAPRTDEHAVGG